MHAEVLTCKETGGNCSTWSEALTHCQGGGCCAGWPQHTHLKVLPGSCKAAVDAPHGVLHGCKLMAELCLNVLS